ncbi:hypothetical protein MANES_12G146500v8 [Manihot esculenta]|uniref:Uncharacterized protein n=2 Tax=Manihot esculenta TaxID=3983 RepID=A0ACB7GRD3_MANES|nr:hypothetical protein MANES_12G146500v8 [Manihot esculenta]
MVMAAELQSSHRTHKVLTELEMVAAQQLMQLSDEDNSNSINRNSKNKINNCDDNEEESFDRSSQDEITSKKKIEEIFGKEEEFIIIQRPKKRRFRSLQSIYEATKPLNVRHGKINHREVRHSKET